MRPSKACSRELSTTTGARRFSVTPETSTPPRRSTSSCRSPRARRTSRALRWCSSARRIRRPQLINSVATAVPQQQLRHQDADARHLHQRRVHVPGCLSVPGARPGRVHGRHHARARTDRLSRRSCEAVRRGHGSDPLRHADGGRLAVQPGMGLIRMRGWRASTSRARWSPPQADFPDPVRCDAHATRRRRRAATPPPSSTRARAMPTGGTRCSPAPNFSSSEANADDHATRLHGERDHRNRRRHHRAAGVRQVRVRRHHGGHSQRPRAGDPAARRRQRRPQHRVPVRRSGLSAGAADDRHPRRQSAAAECGDRAQPGHARHEETLRCRRGRARAGRRLSRIPCTRTSRGCTSGSTPTRPCNRPRDGSASCSQPARRARDIRSPDARSVRRARRPSCLRRTRPSASSNSIPDLPGAGRRRPPRRSARVVQEDAGHLRRALRPGADHRRVRDRRARRLADPLHTVGELHTARAPCTAARTASRPRCSSPPR